VKIVADENRGVTWELLTGRNRWSAISDKAPMLSTSRILLVGHAYVAKIHRQKLHALVPFCSATALIIPENWDTSQLLFGCEVWAESDSDMSYTVYPCRVVRSGHIASHWYHWHPLVAALARFRPSLVQIDQEVYSFASAQVTLVAKLLGSKVCVFGWENVDRRIHPSQRMCRRAVLALADGMMCGSRKGEQLLRVWGYRGSTAIIPQVGVDAALFGPGERKGDGLTVGYLGRLAEEKGIDVLIRAVKRLTTAGIRLSALICVDGQNWWQLYSMARDLQISDRIAWMSPVKPERVPDVLGGVDVLVLPSRTTPWWCEQFGHILIEAMAMGIPVLGSSSGAIPEVIGREDAVFPEDDENALAVLLRRVMSDTAWRKELAESGRTRVLKEFTHTRIAEKIAHYWGRILCAER
jgi:glycosyltransferase involved in cell wall biosynthesis